MMHGLRIEEGAEWQPLPALPAFENLRVNKWMRSAERISCVPSFSALLPRHSRLQDLPG